MNEIQIIGIGDDGAAGLTPSLLQQIREADLLVGGERQLAFFPEFEGETYAIKGALSELTARLQKDREAGRKIVLLASGDPLFYGIGSYLAQKLPQVVVHPHLSSLQLAFAKIGLGWQDAKVISLHGKSIRGLAQRVDGQEKVALLTDPTNTPAAIARYLLDFGIEEYRAFVAENLGSKEEKGIWLELPELVDREFSALNVLILLRKQEAPSKRHALGIADEEFAQRKPDKGLITKKEVRVLSLAELNLQADSIVWDIGTCTASVAIEAAKIATEGQVFAIEKNEADLESARRNLVKFRADVTLVHGKAPAGLESRPDPDAIFIGGSGGEMGEVLRIGAERLRPDGRIVLNAATIETLYEALQIFAGLGLETRVTLLQTARSKPILQMTRFEGLNPIYIITAFKPNSAEAQGEEQA